MDAPEYEVQVDFAYEGARSNEDHQITLFARDYGVRAEVVGRANGWPVLRLVSRSRSTLETILEDRDESWRSPEIAPVGSRLPN